MQLRYDEDFVEEAVQLCATGRRHGISTLQIARFNRERERLYDLLEPEDRNDAFFALHLEWFREWGLEPLLTEPLKAFPLLSAGLAVLAFRKSRGRSDEGAELYVNAAGERSGVVAMRPERLAQELQLEAFLGHELAHLEDMVNPAFGYEPELPALGLSVNQHRLARERYRLLWDVSIDGRLTRSGRRTISTKAQRWSELTGVFALWSETRRQDVFESLWNHPALTHSMFVNLVLDPSSRQPANQPRPGAPCPLCGFPTFAWADSVSLAAETVSAVRAEFPDWTPAQGACARCVAIYRVNRRPVPVTL